MMKFEVGDRVVVYHDADEDVEVHEPGTVDSTWAGFPGPDYDVVVDSSGGFIRCFEGQLDTEGGQRSSLSRDEQGKVPPLSSLTRDEAREIVNALTKVFGL